MTSTPFSRAEQRVNRAVQSRLSNAMCSVDGGLPFPVLFDREAKDALGLIAGNAPSVSFALESAPAVSQRSRIEVQGVALFEVVEPVEPDASDWVTLQLREVSDD